MIKKRFLTIGILVAVAALLAAGIWLVLKIEPDPALTGEGQSAEESVEFGFTVTSENIRVFQFAPENVDYMEIINPQETYQVRMVEGQVQIVGFESIPLLSASSEGLFNSVKNLRLEMVIAENCENLGDFGLAEPQAKITIQARNGAVVTFLIGNQESSGEYYYMCVEGETTVYLMRALYAERYLKSVREYCDPKIYKTFEPVVAEDFVGLSVKSPTVEYKFRKATEEEQKDGVYFGGVAMEVPFAWGGDSETMETVMSSMVELIASEVVAVCVTDADLSQYGLDPIQRTEIVLSVNADPNPTMYNDKTNAYFDSSKPTGVKEDYTVTYWVGAVSDTMVYVMFEDRPVVYTVPRETFSWVNLSPYRFSSKLLFGEYISNIDALSVNTPDRKLTFELKNSESNDKDELRVTCNGVNIDGNEFRDYYANLISLYPSGEGSMPEDAGEPDLELVYVRKDGTSQAIRFYKMDYLSYAANVNGQTFLSVSVSEIEKAINDAQKLLNGEEIMS